MDMSAEGPFYYYNWDLIDAEYSRVYEISAEEFAALKPLDHDAKSANKAQEAILEQIFDRYQGQADADLRPSELEAAINSGRVITTYG